MSWKSFPSTARLESGMPRMTSPKSTPVPRNTFGNNDRVKTNIKKGGQEELPNGSQQKVLPADPELPSRQDRLGKMKEK